MAQPKAILECPGPQQLRIQLNFSMEKLWVYLPVVVLKPFNCRPRSDLIWKRKNWRKGKSGLWMDQPGLSKENEKQELWVIEADSLVWFRLFQNGVRGKLQSRAQILAVKCRRLNKVPCSARPVRLNQWVCLRGDTWLELVMTSGKLLPAAKKMVFPTGGGNPVGAGGGRGMLGGVILVSPSLVMCLKTSAHAESQGNLGWRDPSYKCVVCTQILEEGQGEVEASTNLTSEDWKWHGKQVLFY
ncbi:uncharacterized protein LOC135297037 isoform X1 [Passer domesticus]|uniref:uncharacterized protein LOC135297037 isoform X1 n=1 Tax=Passer domesticus TaxID=48849 RepID=UPI0030FEBB6B